MLYFQYDVVISLNNKSCRDPVFLVLCKLTFTDAQTAVLYAVVPGIK